MNRTRFEDTQTKMREGKLIPCGVWPYLGEMKLTCRGYDLLKKKRVHIKREYPDALSLQIFNRHALIGMTRGLRHRLDKENQRKKAPCLT